jgi:hypothetical protein
MTTICSLVGVVTEDVVSSTFNVEVVSLFPCFLYQPITTIMLAHVVNDVFKFGQVGGCIDKDVTIRILWTVPQTLSILDINHGMFNCLFCVFIVVAFGFIGLQWLLGVVLVAR